MTAQDSRARQTEASRPVPRLLSISHLTVLDASPPELVTAAADAGFDAVGIRVWPAADEPGYPMLGDTPMLRETLLRLTDTGTCVLDVEVLRLRPDSRMDDALRILDAGARLQACLEFMIFSSVKTIADAERVLNRRPGRKDGRRADPPGPCGPHRVAGQGEPGQRPGRCEVAKAADGGLASWAPSALTCYRLHAKARRGPLADQQARVYPRPGQTSR